MSSIIFMLILIINLLLNNNRLENCSLKLNLEELFLKLSLQSDLICYKTSCLKDISFINVTISYDRRGALFDNLNKGEIYD